MPKYLWEASYSPEGMKGLMKEGGTSRVNTLEKIIQSMGGTLEQMYWTFGDKDVILIGDMPSNSNVAALAMAVGASGAVSVKTTVLLTAEEVDDAAEQTVDYKPPGA